MLRSLRFWCLRTAWESLRRARLSFLAEAPWFVRSLEKHGGPRAVKPSLEAFQDGEEHFRIEAGCALRSLGTAGVDGL